MTEELEINRKGKKAQSERIKVLLRRHKKLIGTEAKTANFEGITLLLAKNGNYPAEIHHKVTPGDFEFTHTDGSKRFITLGRDYIYMEYGNKTIPIYICHEDYPVPLTKMMDPVIATDTTALVQEKTVQELQGLKKGINRQKAEAIKEYAKAAAIIGLVAVGIWVLGFQGGGMKLFDGLLSWFGIGGQETIKEVIVQNATNITQTLPLGGT